MLLFVIAVVVARREDVAAVATAARAFDLRPGFAAGVPVFRAPLEADTVTPARAFAVFPLFAAVGVPRPPAAPSPRFVTTCVAGIFPLFPPFVAIERSPPVAATFGIPLGVRPSVAVADRSPSLGRRTGVAPLDKGVGTRPDVEVRGPVALEGVVVAGTGSTFDGAEARSASSAGRSSPTAERPRLAVIGTCGELKDGATNGTPNDGVGPVTATPMCCLTFATLAPTLCNIRRTSSVHFR